MSQSDFTPLTGVVLSVILTVKVARLPLSPMRFRIILDVVTLLEHFGPFKRNLQEQKWCMCPKISRATSVINIHPSELDVWTAFWSRFERHYIFRDLYLNLLRCAY